MHPKTAAALHTLNQSLKDADRLQRRLTRLAACNPPIYWQLDADILHAARHLVFALQTQRKLLLEAHQASQNF